MYFQKYFLPGNANIQITETVNIFKIYTYKL